jgi:hypothetical protein
VIALSLVVASCVVQVVRKYNSPNAGWREAIAVIAKSGRSDDGVIICPGELRPAADYYLAQLGTRAPKPISPSAPWSTGLNIDVDPRRAQRAWANGPDRIWMLPGTAHSCGLPAGVRVKTLRRGFRSVGVQRYNKR